MARHRHRHRHRPPRLPTTTTTLLLAVLLPSALATPYPYPQIHPQNQPTIKPPSPFTKTLFHDDFSLLAPGSLPSPQKWTLDIGTSYPSGPAHWGTNEIQTYTSSPSNIGITPSGTLRIIPLAPTTNTTKGKNKNSTWTSARIETTKTHDFSCGAGQRLRIEAGIRLPSGPAAEQMGIWPAFWSLGAAFRGNYQSWPGPGEVDVMESVNGAATVWHTVHCGVGSGGPCKEMNGLGSTAAMSRGVWHVVAVEIDRSRGGTGRDDWKAEKLVWFVDERQTWSLTGATVGNATAWATLARSPKFLLLNVAVGGAFPDAVAGGKTPTAKTPTAKTLGGAGAAMEVRHVAVFVT